MVILDPTNKGDSKRNTIHCHEVHAPLLDVDKIFHHHHEIQASLLDMKKYHKEIQR